MCGSEEKTARKLNLNLGEREGGIQGGGQEGRKDERVHHWTRNEKTYVLTLTLS